MILIIIKFCELLLRISPRIINSLRSYIKHSKECFLLFPNTSKLVKKNSAAPRFFNLLPGVWKSEEILFLVFDLLRETSPVEQICKRNMSPQQQCFVQILPPGVTFLNMPVNYSDKSQQPFQPRSQGLSSSRPREREEERPWERGCNLSPSE